MCLGSVRCSKKLIKPEEVVVRHSNPQSIESELQEKDWIYNWYVKCSECSLELSPYPVGVCVSPHGQCLN